MTSNETNNYVIKYLPDGSKIGWMKTPTEKFYMSKTTLTIVPIESNTSEFAGMINRVHKITFIAQEFKERVLKHNDALIRMHKALIN